MGLRRVSDVLFLLAGITTPATVEPLHPVHKGDVRCDVFAPSAHIVHLEIPLGKDCRE